MIKNVWLWVLTWAVKGLFSIRYRIKVKGLDSLTPERLNKKGGILFLPNHPAEIDPIILVISLWKKFHLRPIIVEHFYYLPVGHYFVKLIGSLPLPDMNGAVNKWKQKKIEKLFAYVHEELEKGENFLIYPAGRLKVSGAEIVGGASFVPNLLKECPESNVVLIRTTGLWGSRFSRAITGKSPDFFKVFWEGFKIVLKNGIFLTPRRDVTIEIEPAPADFPITGTRLEINQYLEKWYNKNGPEPLKLVSDLFWKNSVPQAAPPKEAKKEAVVVPPEIEKEVMAKIAEVCKRSPDQIKQNMHLSRDLGLDSLDVAQIYVFLDQRYDVEGLTPGLLQTVGDVLEAASGKKEASSIPSEEKIPKANWPAEHARLAVAPPAGKTIMEAFLNVCDRLDGHAATADATYGVMTYRRLKLAAVILSRKIRELDGKYIGVLLPSSTAAMIVVLAILLAKKTPVMLNWTVGVRALDHCARMTDLNHVLSSRRFLNNLNNGDLGKIDEQLILLEDFKEEISLGQKIAGFFDLLKDANTLLKNFDLKDVSEDESAVILFTSGTESLPKGVPLSHRNILSNQTASLSCTDFHLNDVMYSVLPPFHSFGFSATGLFPILTGMRVYFAPDPNHAHGMVNDIFNWKASIFCCAPTFIKGLFRVAKPKQLENLRYIVSGAEKTPDEFFEYVAKNLPKTELIEGYGVTECSPVVSICRPGTPRHGVGQPLPGVKLCVIDPETSEVLPQGKEGEVCISGPNVFQGYLGKQKSPFVTLQGEKWYRSGDRGIVDTDGALVLSGRLKRFVKIGGEMVSLGGLEEEILRIAAEKKWAGTSEKEGPPLAVAVHEVDGGKPQIVLFTTFDISKDDVNDAIRDCGYGKIVKIADVRKVEQIPLTGTGKVHYSALDEMIA